MKNTKAALAAATMLTLVASAPALAQVRAEPSWYIGAGGGTGKVRFDEGSYLTFGTATTAGFVPDSSAPMGKVFAGLKLTRHLGAEVGYYYFDKFGATREFASPATGTLSTRIRMQGVSFDLVGHLPVAQGFSLFAKIGTLTSRMATDGDTSGALFTGFTATDTKRTETNLKYGVGAELALARNWALRGEWELVKNVGNRNNYNFESDLQVVSGSLIGRF